MAHIVLIRHGQSANNAGAEQERVPDPGLTEIGAQQAQETANWLSGVKVDQLFCSPFLRSMLTTRPISLALSLPATVRSDLCEQGGCYSGYEAIGKSGSPGMNRQQLQALQPKWHLDASISESGWWKGPFEDAASTRKRAQSVTDWMLNQFGDSNDTCVFVIHADFKRRLLETILPHPEMAGDLLGPLCNAGVTDLECHNSFQHKWRMHSVNSTSHLPDSLKTA